MNSLKSKPKTENIDLTILKVFLTHPSIFRHYADVALLTLNQNRIRTVHRALERLHNAELLKRYRISSYLNAELINSLYGKKRNCGRIYLPMRSILRIVVSVWNSY